MRDDQKSEATKKDDHLRRSICTYTGVEFFPFEPKADAIHLRDMAHALALKTRFTGHTLLFYSVAQHCVLVSWWLESQYGSRELAQWGLVHDAYEAYMPDIASPVKGSVFLHHPDGTQESFKEAENRFMQVLAKKLGLSWPQPPEVKVADAVVFIAEKHALMPDVPWWAIVPAPSASAPEILPWPWEVAEKRWQSRFLELFVDAVQEGGRGK